MFRILKIGASVSLLFVFSTQNSATAREQQRVVPSPTWEQVKQRPETERYPHALRICSKTSVTSETRQDACTFVIDRSREAQKIRQTEEVSALVNRSEALLASGMSHAAIADADQAVLINPESDIAQNQACWSRAFINVELEKARQHCILAVGLSGGMPEILDSDALLSLRRGDWQRAYAEYNRIYKMNGANLVARYGRALAARGMAAAGIFPEEWAPFAEAELEASKSAQGYFSEKFISVNAVSEEEVLSKK